MAENSVITHYRKRKKLKMYELADLMGVTRQTLYNWESKKVTPSILVCEELAKILSIGVKKIMNDYIK